MPLILGLYAVEKHNLFWLDSVEGIRWPCRHWKGITVAVSAIRMVDLVQPSPTWPENLVLEHGTVADAHAPGCFLYFCRVERTAETPFAGRVPYVPVGTASSRRDIAPDSPLGNADTAFAVYSPLTTQVQRLNVKNHSTLRLVDTFHTWSNGKPNFGTVGFILPTSEPG